MESRYNSYYQPRHFVNDRSYMDIFTMKLVSGQRLVISVCAVTFISSLPPTFNFVW